MQNHRFAGTIHKGLRHIQSEWPKCGCRHGSGLAPVQWTGVSIERNHDLRPLVSITFRNSFAKCSFKIGAQIKIVETSLGDQHAHENPARDIPLHHWRAHMIEPDPPKQRRWTISYCIGMDRSASMFTRGIPYPLNHWLGIWDSTSEQQIVHHTTSHFSATSP